MIKKKEENIDIVLKFLENEFRVNAIINYKISEFSGKWSVFQIVYQYGIQVKIIIVKIRHWTTWNCLVKQ
jgi:hypothetical protein